MYWIEQGRLVWNSFLFIVILPNPVALGTEQAYPATSWKRR